MKRIIPIFLLFICALSIVGCKKGYMQQQQEQTTAQVPCFACNGNKSCRFCNGLGYNLDPYTGMVQACSGCKGGRMCALCYGTGMVAAPKDASEWEAYERMRLPVVTSTAPSNPGKQTSDSDKCSMCHGTGNCWSCAGIGVKTYEVGFAEYQTIDCDECVGGTCRFCYGTGHQK